MNRIAQRSPETFEGNFHYVCILKSDSSAKTQAIGAEKMNVYISRPAVRLKFKVMVLKILQAVAHLRLACSESPGPEDTALAFNLDLRRHRGEFRIGDEFRAQRASSKLRARQIQVILLLESMI